jgi:hypothetical protein
MSCRVKTGVSLVALGPLRSQKSTPVIAIVHDVTQFYKLIWKVITQKFPELGPSSYVGTREVEDCRPNKLRYFLGLGFTASGRRDLSIREVGDCNICRRAQWQDT